MAEHARELIAEMEEDYQNPAAAWIEGLLAKRAAARLIRRHGSRLLRELLVALADVADFPPARYLWNAGHPDVPLHCFLRMRREPVFRILTSINERKGSRFRSSTGPRHGKGDAPRIHPAAGRILAHACRVYRLECFHKRGPRVMHATKSPAASPHQTPRASIPSPKESPALTGRPTTQ